MDGTRFDQITRLVSRRQVIKTAVAAIVAGFARKGSASDVSATGCLGITCSANVTQSNDPNQCGAVVTYAMPSPNGTCPTVSCSPPSGSFFPVGTTPVNCVADTQASCSFNVTINDTQPPTITCPADISVIGTPPEVVNFTTTASDNCPGVTLACVPPSGTGFPAGVTPVTCTANDANGNTATCTFDVEIIEPTATPTDTATETSTETETETATETEIPTETETAEDTETVPPGSTDTATVQATDVPATEVPTTDTPTEDPETQSPATEVPTATTAAVTQLPNTGSNDGGSKNWLLPAGLLGAGAALAARIGLRNVTRVASVDSSGE